MQNKIHSKPVFSHLLLPNPFFFSANFQLICPESFAVVDVLPTFLDSPLKRDFRGFVVPSLSDPATRVLGGFLGIPYHFRLAEPKALCFIYGETVDAGVQIPFNVGGVVVITHSPILPEYIINLDY